MLTGSSARSLAVSGWLAGAGGEWREEEMKRGEWREEEMILFYSRLHFMTAARSSEPYMLFS